MTPEQQYVLDTIAQGESPDYNTLYQGHKFKSTAAHPGIAIPIGQTGMSSTAAGRYQFLKPTWDAVAEHLELKDFSPKSQDQAAWWLAQRTYRQNTGRDLEADAKEKNVQWGAMVKQWPSLQRFAKPESTPGAAGVGPQVLPELGGAVPQMLSQLSPGTGGYAPLPSNPLMLPGASTTSRSLVPVDHDPFGEK